MTNSILALSEVTAPFTRPPSLVANVEPCPRRKPSRVLVISNNPASVNEVLKLVRDSDVEVARQSEGSSDWQSLTRAAENADLVVLVGLPTEEAQASFASAIGKPVLWLPKPQPAAPEPWGGGASMAVHAALGYLVQGTASPSRSGSSEEPCLDTHAGELRQGGRSVRITPTECNLLRVLLATRGRWISASELKLKAFGPDHACHDSLIRVHVYKLRRKLSPITAQIRSAKGRGYMFDGAGSHDYNGLAEGHVLPREGG